MKAKQKTNWWIDLVLFAGFITTFFLDLTGVQVHQWLGILCGELAAFHLFIHFDWVAAVSKRFFAKTSSRVRMNYFLDAVLLLGFVLIVLTGLVISTWLNLPLGNYTTWLSVHITISIVTLAALLLKLAFHWRWIAHAARNARAQPVPSLENAAPQPARASSGSMGRREFLHVMGVVGTSFFLALINASKGLAETVAAPGDIASIDTAAVPKTITGDADPTKAVATVEESATAAAAPTGAAATTETVVPTEVIAPTATSTATPSSQSFLSNSSCTVRCQKGCSYPGRCRRYVDTNNNNRCDLGECI